MAPNWLGVTEKAIARARLLAGDRYVVFVADLYGQGTRPADFTAAAALANPLRENAIEHRRRIRAAYDTMVAEASRRNLIDGRRAPVGFCFGGGSVLDLRATAPTSPPRCRSMEISRQASRRSTA
jgi:dienelactone hydrolase